MHFSTVKIPVNSELDWPWTSLSFLIPNLFVWIVVVCIETVKQFLVCFNAVQGLFHSLYTSARGECTASVEWGLQCWSLTKSSHRLFHSMTVSQYDHVVPYTAGSSLEEVPYCFSRSSVKFQGHVALKIVEFDPNWAFPDSNSSLNSPMAMKCCTKLETAKERCPFVFQGHPSNFKVTWDKTSPILTQIGRFRTIDRSQLSNLSDLSCYRTIS